VGHNGETAAFSVDCWPITCQLLVGLEVWVMTTVVMAVVVNNHYNLRLRRVGYREAEEKGDSEQYFLHSLV
jgi:hypothetical protein